MNNKSSNNSLSNNDFDLWVLMDRARSAISRSRELELAVYGITPEQAAILHTLQGQKGAATIAEIADMTVRQYNSVTTLVNRMAKNGLVKKKRSSRDKKYIVSITSKGQSTYEKLTRKSYEMAFSCLSLEDKQKLFLYLKKLLETGRKMLGMDFKPPFLPS
jgi:DNA-binding MarR family transcriptional regulator